MCDQGNEVVFQSNGWMVHELDIRNTVIKVTRTPNIYTYSKEDKNNVIYEKQMKNGYGTEDWVI